MLWMVILGELVVKRLVAVGMAVDGVPRRVLKAGRKSLDVIGRKWGGLQVRKLRCIKGFRKSSRAATGQWVPEAFLTNDVIQGRGICQCSMTRAVLHFLLAAASGTAQHGRGVAQLLPSDCFYRWSDMISHQGHWNPDPSKLTATI
jgi:hypothetical protein